MAYHIANVLHSDPVLTLRFSHLLVRMLCLSLCVLALSSAYAEPQVPIAQVTAPHVPMSDSRLRPLPIEAPLDELSSAQTVLGEVLFHDSRLSNNGRFSCASCHDLSQGGDDGLPLSRNAQGGYRQHNTPSIFNVKYNFRLNWNGAFDGLASHLSHVIQSPATMGRSFDDLLSVLRSEPYYRQRFENLYEDGLTLANVFAALDLFQRSLVTPNADFDRYLRGERDALSEQAKRGYHLFEHYGCSSCHQGRNIGGNMYQKFGVFGDYALDTHGGHRPEDYGRYQVTGNEQDKFYFRVPSLRNVALTAPFFHDGSVATLEQAVALMARYQLGRELLPQEQADIVAFLESLTGEYHAVSTASKGQ